MVSVSWCGLRSRHLHSKRIMSKEGEISFVHQSFRLENSGSLFMDHNEDRFGPGIYTFVNPKLADTEATTSSTSPYRVMVACDVLVDAGQEVSHIHYLSNVAG